MIFFANFIFSFSLVVLTFYTIFVLFLIVGWKRTKAFQSSEKLFFGSTKISVIIPVRNEEKNIANCLESLYLQDYPKELTEIIIVDDSSEDETISVAKNALKKLFFQKNIFLTSKKSGKKNALSFGIENANGTLIITTDADCTFTKEWLSTIVSFYEKEHSQFIFAPVVFDDEKNIFSKIQNLEFCGLVAAGGASAYFNFPILCNGANLAFEKIIFEKVKGFEGNEHIDSGDDLFLMEKIRKIPTAKINFLKSAKATVKTQASPNLKLFIAQRKRWASKTVQLKNKFTWCVGFIIWLMNFCVVSSAFLIVYNTHFIALFLFLFAGKCIIDFLFLFLAVSFFGKRKYILYTLLLQVFYPIYVLYVSFFGSFGKIKWKNRVVRR